MWNDNGMVIKCFTNSVAMSPCAWFIHGNRIWGNLYSVGNINMKGVARCWAKSSPDRSPRNQIERIIQASYLSWFWRSFITKWIGCF